MTWNVEHASSVASGRWSKSAGGVRTGFCEAFRDGLEGATLSGGEALSTADFAVSGDRLEAREFILEPPGVLDALVSSLLILLPFILTRSSTFNDPLLLASSLLFSIGSLAGPRTTGRAKSTAAEDEVRRRRAGPRV